MIAGYIRVSTQKQAHDGVSIDMQMQMIIKHAKMFEIIKDESEVNFFIDDGYSASSLARPQMQKLIMAIKAGSIKVLFAYDLSRISRDIFDSNVFLNLIQKYDIVLKCLYDEAKTQSAGDRLNTNVKLVYNQYEREKVVERTNDGLKTIAEKGRYPIGGKVLFGYKRGKDKDIYIHEDNFKIVKKAFEMACERYSIKDIVNYMNSCQKERIFYTYQIQQMFNDKRYAGFVTYKGKEYDNIIPAIITSKEQEKAARHYRKWKYKHNKEYYFDDLVFCCCGTKMTCSCSHGRNQKYYYYLCSKCKMTVSQYSLEEYISNITLSTETRKDELKFINSELYKMNRKLNNIREKYFNKKLSDREYCSLAIAVEDRMEEYSMRKSGLRIKNKRIDYKSLVTKEEKKEFIQGSFRKIVVDPIKKIVIEIVQN